jgi:glycerate 2-kinase
MIPTAVVVAQPFKGTMDAHEVAQALARGVEAAGCRARIVKASDGGDGLLDALAPRRRTTHHVTGPLGERVPADLGWLDGRTAVVESRLACGLSLIPPSRRNPLVTTTRGVGELVAAAAQEGASVVFVGLGGSATMDGGLGMARAWGWTACDREGRPLAEGGGALETLEHLDRGRTPAVRLVGLSDVRNVLLGEDGAAVYAPQKGASPHAVERLAAGLRRLVELTVAWNGPALAAREGAGAAGGLGFGLMCFGGGTVIPGAPWVLERVGFPSLLEEVNLVVVGEARFDRTSLDGKLPGEVLQTALRRRVPAALVAPSASDVPAGVVVESAVGQWTPDDLARHAERAVRRALCLPLT